MKMTSHIYKVIMFCYTLIPFKKQFCVFLRFLKIPNNKFYKDFRFKGVFQIKVGNTSFKMVNNSHQTIENEIFWKGLRQGWEKISVELWLKLSKESKTVFDIGANTGIYCLLSKTINQEASVFAFEPSRKVYRGLVQNIEVNNYTINYYPLAISNLNGSQTFFDTTSEHQYSASLSKAMRSNLMNENLNVVEYQVETITLDSFIEDNRIGSIDLIKIDVELHEVEVLKGFERYLPVFKPTFLIEILSDKLAQEIQKCFDGHNYLYFSIDEISQPKQCEKLVKSGFYNFLVCQEKVARSLELI